MSSGYETAHAYADADSAMAKPIVISTLLHILLFGMTAVGLPFVVNDPLLMHQPIQVELVEIDEITQTTNNASPAPEPVEDIPTPPAQEKPAPPQMLEEAPPEPVSIPDEPVEAVPAPPKDTAEPETQAVVIPREKPKPPPKPAAKEVTKKAEPAPKKDFQTLLRNLTPDASAGAENQPDIGDSAPESGQIAQLGDRLTMSEMDAIRQQLSRCWYVQAGAKYAEDLVVSVRVNISPDRLVRNAYIMDQARYNSDSHFRSAADSAVRALRNPACSPLDLPPGKYEEWKTIIIRFDPQDML